MLLAVCEVSVTFPFVEALCCQMRPVRLSVIDKVPSSALTVTDIAALPTVSSLASPMDEQHNNTKKNIQY